MQFNKSSKDLKKIRKFVIDDKQYYGIGVKDSVIMFDAEAYEQSLRTQMTNRAGRPIGTTKDKIKPKNERQLKPRIARSTQPLIKLQYENTLSQSTTPQEETTSEAAQQTYSSSESQSEDSLPANSFGMESYGMDDAYSEYCWDSEMNSEFEFGTEDLNLYDYY